MVCRTSAAVTFECVRVLKTLCLYARNGCETAAKVGVASWRYCGRKVLGNRLVALVLCRRRDQPTLEGIFAVASSALYACVNRFPGCFILLLGSSKNAYHNCLQLLVWAVSQLLRFAFVKSAPERL